jgi:glycosyltransferase involved in cell wall biosynthesis
MRSPIRVRIIHQVDPDGLIPGGISTFIRGLIKAAPADVKISIVGLTTDPVRRPVGRWSVLERSGRVVPFFPVGRDHTPGQRSLIPLSVRMAAGVSRHLRACSASCDVLEFHRFEPMLPFLFDRRPKNAFVHQNMNVLRNAQSDIMWKHMPGLYFALERRVVPQFASVFCVRADAVDAYRATFPTIADRFRFTPTWVDPDVFHPTTDERRAALRKMFEYSLGVLPNDEVLMWVGRLDQQKDPVLLVESFARINSARPNTRLIIVGDGVLRSAIAARVKTLGLESRVIFTGLRAAQEVADLLQIAHGFLLTSAYEGMPMSVLEALGCGVPVVTTKVGEVERVVHSGVNGEIVEEHSAKAFAAAVLALLAEGGARRGAKCVDAVREYVPERVLAPIYENYRRLARGGLQS